jgi:hypothetical protein
VTWGLNQKNPFFYHLTPDFKRFWFVAACAHTECAVNKKKIYARPKLKVGGGCLGAQMCAYNVFYENFKFLGFL